MLDPIFSTTDLFLRDPGPRRTFHSGPAWAQRRGHGTHFPERDADIRRR